MPGETLNPIYLEEAGRIVEAFENPDFENIADCLVGIREARKELGEMSPATGNNLRLLTLLATHLYLAGDPTSIIQRVNEKLIARAEEKHNKGEITATELEQEKQPTFVPHPHYPESNMPSTRGKKILQEYLHRTLLKYLQIYQESSDAEGEIFYPTIGHELETSTDLTEAELVDAIRHDPYEVITSKGLGSATAISIISRLFPYRSVKDLSNMLEIVTDPTMSPRAQMRILRIVDDLTKIDYAGGKVNLHETIGGIKLDLEHVEPMMLRPMWEALGYNSALNQQVRPGVVDIEVFAKFSDMGDGDFMYFPFHKSKRPKDYTPVSGESGRNLVEFRSNPVILDPSYILAQARKVDFDFCAATCIQAAQGLSKLPPEKAQRLADEWAKLESSFANLNLSFGIGEFPIVDEIVTPVLSETGIRQFFRQTSDPNLIKYRKDLLSKLTNDHRFGVTPRLQEKVTEMLNEKWGSEPPQSILKLDRKYLVNIEPTTAEIIRGVVIKSRHIYASFYKRCGDTAKTKPEYRAAWRKEVIQFKKRVKDIIHDRDQQS